MHRFLSYLRRKAARLVMKYKDYRMEQQVEALKASYGDTPPPQEEVAAIMLADIDHEAMACSIKITNALLECSRWYGNENLWQTWRFGYIYGKVLRFEYLTPEEEVCFNRMWVTTTPNATLHAILMEHGDIQPHAKRFLENSDRGEEFKTWLSFARITVRPKE